MRGFKAVITAGGIGTRLLPFTKEIPKEMSPLITRNSGRVLEVKPIIQAIYEQLFTAGIRDFFVIVGRGKRAIEDHFAPDTAFVDSLNRRRKNGAGLTEFYGKLQSSNVTFVVQASARGFGDAVFKAGPYITDRFLVHAGDTYVISANGSYLERLKEAHFNSKADATLLLQDVRDARQFGVVFGDKIRNGTLQVRKVVEKPKSSSSTVAIMPVYIFEKSIFEALRVTQPDKGGEIQLTDAIQTLITQGKKIIGVKLRRDEPRLDIGTPETLIEALQLSSKYLAHS